MSVDIKYMPEAPKIDLRQLPVLAKRQIDKVNLPENYVAARKALQKCVRVDECKDIADKHDAIAHYAKQIKDDSLRYYAERVHRRALIRIGELLRDLPAKERKALAKKNGFSYPVANDAVNMSFLPKKAADKLIEKSPPASKGEMSRLGSKIRHPDRGGMGFNTYARIEEYDSPYGRAKATIDSFLGAFEHCPGGFKFSSTRSNGLPDAYKWAFSLKKDEAKKIKERLVDFIDWLDEFDEALEARMKGS